MAPKIKAKIVKMSNTSVGIIVPKALVDTGVLEMGKTYEWIPSETIEATGNKKVGSSSSAGSTGHNGDDVGSFNYNHPLSWFVTSNPSSQGLS